MTLVTTTLTVTGGVLLAHAIYSAYEHSLLANPTTITSSTSTTLPLDITLETLFSTLLLTLSIVLSAPALRPIRWSEWAGKIEREGWDPLANENEKFVKLVGGGDGVGLGGKVKGGAGNPFKALEERRGFLDVRASRKAFAHYIRNGSAAGTKSS